MFANNLFSGESSSRLNSADFRLLKFQEGSVKLFQFQRLLLEKKKQNVKLIQYAQGKIDILIQYENTWNSGKLTIQYNQKIN